MDSANFPAPQALFPQKSTKSAILYGDAPAFRSAVNLALRAAASDCSVLILGETGTGKELIARAIHEASSRRRGPMVAVNCGAIARELIGSELFGHEKGSFTGATTARDGVFVQADGGTLFLDELGELPMEQQPHLLRALETRTVRRVGGNTEQPVDIRLVAATNRVDNLGAPGSRLRLDLFHRLATVVIRLPPLRERVSDIPLLVSGFMSELAPSMGPRTIARSTLRVLCKYSWPGNVRELRQAVTRAMTLSHGELTLDLLLQHVPPEEVFALSLSGKGSSSARRKKKGSVYQGPEQRLRPFDLIVRNVLEDALERHRSIRGAAIALGLPKSTFADWAKRLGMNVS